MVKTSQSKKSTVKYQYQYDSNGKTIGVFIPIKEWTAISKKYKGLSQEQESLPLIKEKIKTGLVKALKEVEKHKKGMAKLQPAKDFISEMRKELK